MVQRKILSFLEITCPAMTGLPLFFSLEILGVLGDFRSKMNNFIRTIYEILYNFLGDSRRKSWFLGDFRRNIDLIVSKILTIRNFVSFSSTIHIQPLRP